MPNITLIWLIFGAGLCLTELFLPTAFVALMMGISAILVAIMSLFIGNVWLQGLAWLSLSTFSVVYTRRLISHPKRKSKIREAIIAETLTEIPPGKAGRVLYEGSSWRARCDDAKLAIAPNAPVYVVGREGTTLIVMPENLLHS
ncbi:NfeD family protein [Mastigocoleus sp. MO_188.B34]|uniref:NfeD family protein n=1 Tax=Mastigocoleus sp. MO_188.B34 TaxID=3036635 RepID=UPI0026335E7F|nr:NfeD family protein [Mastigocoleus sp. MO_188.B34]MDJ0694504.1 NfeD family protein [Mastigocoleus sp. MO_188.B34]